MVDAAHPLVNENTDNFIIAYGSLMQKASREDVHPEIQDVYPVLIHDVKRLWGLADTRYGLSYLTAIHKAGACMNAVYYPCTVDDIYQTDAREYSYYREKLCPSRLQSLGLSSLIAGDYWVYLMPEADIKRPTAMTPLVQSYVDVVLDGCFQIEHTYHIDGFAQQFCDTTSWWPSDAHALTHWVNDRIHPKRPTATPNGLRIDKLLSSIFSGYFDHLF